MDRYEADEHTLTELLDGHLADAAVEALATDEARLVTEALRVHGQRCEVCAARIEHARNTRDVVAHWLDAGALDTVTLDALIADAVRPRTSRDTLLRAGALGLGLAFTLGVLSFGPLPAAGELASALTQALRLLAATGRAIDTAVPGGFQLLVVLLTLLFALMAAPLRTLLGPPRIAAWLLVGFAWAPSAHAQAPELHGTWPETESLTVVAEGVPASIALERAAASAGLGFIGVLPDDPTVHVRVQGAPLREIVLAIVGTAPLHIERGATLLIVRPLAHDDNAAVTTAPSPSAPVSSSGDRVAFGDDVVVRRGEVVDSAVSFGGTVTVEGEVLGDAVSMGGDVIIGPGAVVRGEAVTMGGQVRVDPLGRVGSVVSDITLHLDHPRAAEPHWLLTLMGSAAKHALLFVYGLVLLGLASARLEAVIESVREAPVRTSLTGVLAALAALALFVVLCITLIGIPAALLLMVVAAIAFYSGLVAVAAWIGRALPVPRLADSPVLQLAAGVAVLFLAAQVPFGGTLLLIGAGLTGFGAVVLTRGGSSGRA